MAARKEQAIIVTKDVDFVRLLERHGPPPQILWLTCGNTSNARLVEILSGYWPTIAVLLGNGEPLVEIGDELSR